MKPKYWIILICIALFTAWTFFLYNLGKKDAQADLFLHNPTITEHTQSGFISAHLFNQEISALSDSVYRLKQELSKKPKKVYYAVADTTTRDSSFTGHFQYISDSPIPPGIFNYNFHYKPDTLYVNAPYTAAEYAGTRIALIGGLRFAARQNLFVTRLILGAEYYFVNTPHFDMAVQYEAEFRQLNFSGIDHQITWINRIKF